MEENWREPTEAELKEIERKRERSDLIAHLMGKYMLKGYKMLNDACPKCDTVLLSGKTDKQLYCVACSEVDIQSNTEGDKSIHAESASLTTKPIPPEPFNNNTVGSISPDALSAVAGHSATLLAKSMQAVCGTVWQLAERLQSEQDCENLQRYFETIECGTRCLQSLTTQHDLFNNRRLAH